MRRRVDVGVDVTNTGAPSPATRSCSSTSPIRTSATLPRPRQQLRGFQRVTLAAGATPHVTFSLRAEDLRYWNENAGRFLVEDGRSVELQLGASSRDIRLRVPPAVTR